jgi:mannose-6-phosphate isomerase-like protein (cupin superfamily)
MKQSLNDIKTENAHNNTVWIKRLVTASQNKGKLETCNYAWLEKDKQVETHLHPDGEEFYLFLEGEGEILIGEQWFTVKKDDFVVILQNQSHSLKNNREQRLVFLTIRTSFI